MHNFVPMLIVLLLAACGGTTYTPSDDAGPAPRSVPTEEGASESTDPSLDASSGIESDSAATNSSATGVENTWPPVPDREFDMNAPLHLEARTVAPGETDAQRQMIVVEITNTSSLPTRVWQTWCSWGANTLSLEVRAKGSETIYTIENAVFTWTMNYPATTEIPPGGSIENLIDPYWGYRWRVPEECWTLEGPVEFRAHLRIPDWKDQRKHRVTTCDVYSAWVVSEKPRKWLPDHKTWDMFDGPVEKK